MKPICQRLMLSSSVQITWRDPGPRLAKISLTWKSFSEYDSIGLRKLQFWWLVSFDSAKRGGFVNRLYVCQNKSVITTQEVKQVLLRLYGGKMLDKSDHAFKAFGEVGEVLVYYIMAQNGLGPQIYGVFSGGRIEQFLPVSLLFLFKH